MRAVVTETTGATQADAGLRIKSAQGRWVVAATVLGSGMAALDATVVGIALPAIGRNFHASVASVQWVVDAYTLTLAGLILLGGTLGDSYGRRKVFTIGVVWFAIASLLCGVAPTAGILIAAQALGAAGKSDAPAALAALRAISTDTTADDGLKAVAALAAKEHLPDRTVQLAAAAAALREAAHLPSRSAARTERMLAPAASLGSEAIARLWAEGAALEASSAVRPASSARACAAATSLSMPVVARGKSTSASRAAAAIAPPTTKVRRR